MFAEDSLPERNSSLVLLMFRIFVYILGRWHWRSPFYIRRTSAEVAGRARLLVKCRQSSGGLASPPSAGLRLCRRPFASTTSYPPLPGKVVILSSENDSNIASYSPNNQKACPSQQLYPKSASHMLPKHPFGAPFVSPDLPKA